MLLQTLPVVLGAISHAQTLAGVPSSPGRIQGLSRRSPPDIPKACQAGCAPFAPFMNGASCPVTQCCSMLFEAGYFECFQCVGTSTHSTDFSIAQEYVDVLTTSCRAEGFTLPVLTLPGQNPNRPLVSTLPSDASAMPIFPPVASSSPVSRASQSSGTQVASQTAASGASQSSLSGSGAIGSGSLPPAGSGSQSSVSPPTSQSTATSPPSAPSVSSPVETNRGPSNNAALRPRTRFEAVVGLSVLLVLLLGL
ncbi:hypothetical protein C8R43DRAFT_988817 [Mycena crocata]|nr:hypothetical protein C8R43DRAFT_988817 [Mycena crocata]